MIDLEAVADELYRLLPGEFTAARNVRARELRTVDKGLAAVVAKLPRPSVAAWACNALVRERPDQLRQVLDLGRTLRQAQEDLDPAALRELGLQRRRLVAALAREAVDLGSRLGQNVADATVDELEQTLQAAMADEHAAAAVLSGRLVRSLASTGFEAVDVGGAVAGPVDGVLPAPRRPTGGTTHSLADRRAEKQREKDLAEARAEVEEAQAQAARAQAGLAEAEASRAEADRRRSDLRGRLHQLEEQIAAVEAEITAAGTALRELARKQDEAAEAAERAEQRARRARAQLEGGADRR